MEVVALNMQETQNFIKTYHDAYNQDLTDLKVKDHLVYGAHPEGVSWLNLFKIF